MSRLLTPAVFLMQRLRYAHKFLLLCLLIAIPLGAFDDPYFLKPAFSVWENRKHDWVEIVGDGIEHD